MQWHLHCRVRRVWLHPSIYSFIGYFNRYVLSTKNVPGLVLVTGTINEVPSSESAQSLMGKMKEQIDN